MSMRANVSIRALACLASKEKQVALEPGQTIWLAGERLENIGGAPVELLRIDLRTDSAKGRPKKAKEMKGKI